MKIECVGTGFVYRWPTGAIRLDPGQPVDLPVERALKLIAKAPGRVRIVEDQVVIEPAHPNARPIYFEDIAGRILGPATPEFLAQTGHGLKSTDYWVVTTFEGQIRWIRSDRLRSKQAFDTQKPVHIIELIKEVKGRRS